MRPDPGERGIDLGRRHLDGFFRLCAGAVLDVVFLVILGGFLRRGFFFGHGHPSAGSDRCCAGRNGTILTRGIGWRQRGSLHALGVDQRLLWIRGRRAAAADLQQPRDLCPLGLLLVDATKTRVIQSELWASVRRV